MECLERVICRLTVLYRLADLAGSFREYTSRSGAPDPSGQGTTCRIGRFRGV